MFKIGLLKHHVYLAKVCICFQAANTLTQLRHQPSSSVHLRLHFLLPCSSKDQKKFNLDEKYKISTSATFILKYRPNCQQRNLDFFD